MKESFEKIDDWLKNNAPKLFKKSLRPGATEEKIESFSDDFESKSNLSLPIAFKKLYAWHDGLDDSYNIGSLFYGLDFLSLDNIIVEQSELPINNIDPLKEAPPEINMATMFNPYWVLIAVDNAHCYLYVDLDPTDAGTYGQVIFVDTEYAVAILVANSLDAFLATVADDLESGLYHLDDDALDDDNEFLEVDDSIDLVNWFDSERWNTYT